jgi:hypothetical protein
MVSDPPSGHTAKWPRESAYWQKYLDIQAKLLAFALKNA